MIFRRLNRMADILGTGETKRKDGMKMLRREEKPVVTPEEAGRMLGMSGTFLRKLLREGKMENIGFAVESNGNWRYYCYKDKVRALTEAVG